MKQVFGALAGTRVVLALMVGTVLTACSTLPPSLGGMPDAEALNALPLVKLGQPKPSQGDYVVHLPANAPISLATTVQNNLFEKTYTQMLDVKLKQDLYLYKGWISFDLRNWVKDHKAIGGRLQVALPSYDRPLPGEVMIDFSRK